MTFPDLAAEMDDVLLDDLGDSMQTASGHTLRGRFVSPGERVALTRERGKGMDITAERPTFLVSNSVASARQVKERLTRAGTSYDIVHILPQDDGMTALVLVEADAGARAGTNWR